MKKTILTFFCIGAVAVVIALFKMAMHQKRFDSNSFSPTNATKLEQQTQVVEISRKPLLEATIVTNIAVWTQALPGIRLLNPSTIEESWIFEEASPDKYPLLSITGVDGQNLEYVARFVAVQVSKQDEHIRRIELQSPNMTIEDAKKIGLKIARLLELDPKEFISWCDLVGNQWMDKPVFTSKAGVSPDPNKTIGFTVKATFDNVKPWYITFIMSDK